MFPFFFTNLTDGQAEPIIFKPCYADMHTGMDYWNGLFHTEISMDQILYTCRAAFKHSITLEPYLSGYTDPFRMIWLSSTRTR